MSLTPAEVQRIADLARIEVTEAELEASCNHLSGIFSLIEAMQAADTKGVEPMAHVQDAVQRLREDRVTHLDLDGVQRDKFQAIAPEVEAGLFLVPKVIE